MHTLKYTVLDVRGVEGGFTVERLRHELGRRLHLLPPFRRRLVEVPLGLHHPVWIEDPDFDLAAHVRRVGRAGARAAAGRWTSSSARSRRGSSTAAGRCGSAGSSRAWPTTSTTPSAGPAIGPPGRLPREDAPRHGRRRRGRGPARQRHGDRSRRRRPAAPGRAGGGPTRCRPRGGCWSTPSSTGSATSAQPPGPARGARSGACGPSPAGAARPRSRRRCRSATPAARRSTAPSRRTAASPPPTSRSTTSRRCAPPSASPSTTWCSASSPSRCAATSSPVDALPGEGARRRGAGGLRRRRRRAPLRQQGVEPLHVAAHRRRRPGRAAARHPRGHRRGEGGAQPARRRHARRLERVRPAQPYALVHAAVLPPQPGRSAQPADQPRRVERARAQGAALHRRRPSSTASGRSARSSRASASTSPCGATATRCTSASSAAASTGPTCTSSPTAWSPPSTSWSRRALASGSDGAS